MISPSTPLRCRHEPLILRCIVVKGFFTLLAALFDVVDRSASQVDKKVLLTDYYDVTIPATMASLPLLLWRHYPRYYDVTTPATMTSLL